MLVKLQKWGNSPAVRVPSYMVKELGARYGDELDLEVKSVIKRPRANWSAALKGRKPEPPVVPDVLDDDKLDGWSW
jgi:antitoxin component of MazEF toxin-antitoxin module